MSVKSNFLDNRITLVRLFCAIIVLVSHLDWIAGNPTDKFRRLGLYAVVIFFGLSGFLLTESILRSGAKLNFIRNRVLRIFPGFIGVLFLTSFIFAPLYQIINTGKFEYLFTKENFGYIFKNITTYILQPDINGSLASSNVPIWNPPLWTLSYELVCYFLLFVLNRTLRARYSSFLNLFLPTIIVVYLLKGMLLVDVPSQIEMMLYYTSFFFLGSFVYIKKVHENFDFTILLVLTSFLAFLVPRSAEPNFFDIRDFVLGLFLVPISIFLSFNPKVSNRLKKDYSFGIYIYSAPISQILILNFNNLRHSWILYASCTLVVTFVFSWLSWNLIENPALKFKRL